jgi:hypothetical protein
MKVIQHTLHVLKKAILCITDMVPLHTQNSVPQWWKALPFPENSLTVQCHSCQIGPVIPQNITYILLILSILFTDSWHSSSKCHVHFPLLMSLQRMRPSQRPRVKFRNMLVFTLERCYLPPNPESGGKLPPNANYGNVIVNWSKLLAKKRDWTG